MVSLFISGGALREVKDGLTDDYCGRSISALYYLPVGLQELALHNRELVRASRYGISSLLFLERPLHVIHEHCLDCVRPAFA